MAGAYLRGICFLSGLCGCTVMVVCRGQRHPVHAVTLGVEGGPQGNHSQALSTFRPLMGPGPPHAQGTSKNNPLCNGHCLLTCGPHHPWIVNTYV